MEDFNKWLENDGQAKIKEMCDDLARDFSAALEKGRAEYEKKTRRLYEIANRPANDIVEALLKYQDFCAEERKIFGEQS